MNNKRKSNKRSDINRVIADISAALVGHFKLSSLLNQVVKTTMDTLNAEICSIFLEDKDTAPGILAMVAGSGFASKLVGQASYKIGEAFTGTIAKSGLKFNIKSREELENLELEGKKVWYGRFDREQWPSGKDEFRNCIAIPLKIKDQILGVIKVENKIQAHGDHFTEDDMLYLETMANVVALAIENVRLHKQIEHQLKIIAAKAAHRINNQVTNYDGIELALREQLHLAIPSKEKLLEIVERITITTRSLKRMIGEFRTYGKPITIEKELYDINSIIQNEAWLAKPPSDISIEFDMDRNIPKIQIDSGRFSEAIKELLRNSIKALSKEAAYLKRGKIEISTKLVKEKTKKGKQTGGLQQIEVDILDSGPGFPDKFPIFQPFQSTDPQSTGLGLATVKELIEIHGGKIEAFNREDGGAHIRFTLPTKVDI